MTQDEHNLNLLGIFHYVLGGMTALFSLFPILHAQDTAAAQPPAPAKQEAKAAPAPEAGSPDNPDMPKLIHKVDPQFPEEAKKEGKTKYVGFSAHNAEAALALLDAFPADSVLFPVNFACWEAGGSEAPSCATWRPSSR